jgi:putative aldouronate transport system substrate-binding protein
MKRNPTRLLVLALSLLLLCSSAMAAVNTDGLLPFVTEPIDVKIAVYPQSAIVFSEFDKENYGWIKYLERHSGMNIDWDVYDPATRNETLPLMLAGGEMPDMIQGLFWTVDDINNYGVIQGLLYPIDELLQYMPTYSKILEEFPALRATMTAPDGHMYGLPVLGYHNGLYPYRPWINMDWLKNVGMENPTTLDELYNVLKAFKEMDANGNGDPDDEIPLGGSWSEGYQESQIVLRAFGFTSSGLGLDYSDGVENPSIVYTPYAPEYKEYLSYMHKLYTEGLMDPDIFTQDQLQAEAKMNEGRVGVYNGNNPNSVILTISNHYDHWWAMNALTDKPGETPVVGVYDLTEVYATNVISADCDPKKAAALAKMCDYYFTPEYYEYHWYGPVLNSEDDPEGKGTYWDEVIQEYAYAGNTEGISTWTYKINNFCFWVVPGYVSGNKDYELLLAERNPDSIVGKRIAATGVWKEWEIPLQDKIVPYHVDDIPPLYLSEDDLETCSLLRQQLDEQTGMWEAKFITGELDIESQYGEFVAMLEEYGVKELEEIQNKAYDVYKENLANLK